jgi:diaminohydroxyphosphoribosylaminopyrimidine deaminase / 5-amino-6-(5-phosphoribosylamino)uracil reductase
MSLRGPRDLSLDERFMKEAIALARKGERWVSPNPMVGAVVVRGGRVIARGYHRKFGGPHAEVDALRGLDQDLIDATLYVNLEPCCHHGKTPPCTELILSRRVGRVVVGSLDPNPQVGGRGIQRLREGGLTVQVGVLEEDCRALNRGFFHWMERGTPWVTLKWAQSLDGRIATSSGHSQWITCEASRKTAHALRATHDAVLVGVGTVLSDDPRLTVRHVRGRDPLRVVLDSSLQIPLGAKVLDVSPGGAQTWVVATEDVDELKVTAIEARRARVVRCPSDPVGWVEVRDLLRKMGSSGISSVLVEGGGSVITSFLSAAAAQRLVGFVAPLLLGEGVEAVRDLGIKRVDEAVRFSSWRVARSGADIMVDALLASTPAVAAMPA